MSNDTARELLTQARKAIVDPEDDYYAELIGRIDAYLAQPAGAEVSEGEVDAAEAAYWSKLDIADGPIHDLPRAYRAAMHAALMTLVKGRA